MRQGARDRKYNQLKKLLAELKTAVIAFSGGLDSGVLTAVAYDVLGRNAIAVTAASAIHPPQELKDARAICKKIGIKHIIVKTNELSDEKFRRNYADRCYWCRRRLILELSNTAAQNNISYVLDGTNFDDRNDQRPGFRANKEESVISPLYECRFGKKDIRELARNLHLWFWAKSKSTCFASRIPYGEEINLNKIGMVSRAEDILKKVLGDNCLVRARSHNCLLRIELGAGRWTKLKKSDINKVVPKFKELGYKYITVDLEGYIPAGARG